MAEIKDQQGDEPQAHEADGGINQVRGKFMPVDPAPLH
jgi:hypothetical protein